MVKETMSKFPYEISFMMARFMYRALQFIDARCEVTFCLIENSAQSGDL